MLLCTSQVTTLLTKEGEHRQQQPSASVSPEHVKQLQQQVADQGGKVKEAKAAAAADKGNAELATAAKAEVDKLLHVKQELAAAEEA